MMDQDLWMKALYFHGPELLQTVIGDIPEVKSEVDCEKLAMCKFIKSKLEVLFKPSECVPNHTTSYSIPLVPIEVFRNVSPMQRRNLFYKSLDRGNILTLQVINDTLPNDYKLLVLCKHDCLMKLDDLSLIMYLPKLQEELNLAGGKLESHDLIRAAVCSCDIDNRKLYVTLDSNILDDESESVKLGKISEAELPPYIGNVDFGSSYVEYLHHSPTFKNPNWSEELYSILNLERKRLYSFMEGLDGKVYAEEVYGSELKKKQKLCLANGQLAKAFNFYESGNFTESFMYLNNALKLYPNHVEALVLRGTLYSNTNNLRKAFIDVEQALKIDPEHEGAGKKMSILLAAAGRMHIEKNRLDKAQESLDIALHLDGTNQDAILAVDEIRQRRMAGNIGKTLDMKSRIGSSSSESSCSRKDDKATLEAHTKAFLNSLKKSHFYKKSRHHSHHRESSSSSSKCKGYVTID